MTMTKGVLRRSFRKNGFVTALGGVKWFATSGLSDEGCLCRSFSASRCLALYHLHSNLDKGGVCTAYLRILRRSCVHFSRVGHFVMLRDHARDYPSFFVLSLGFSKHGFSFAPGLLSLDTL